MSIEQELKRIGDALEKFTGEFMTQEVQVTPAPEGTNAAAPASTDERAEVIAELTALGIKIPAKQSTKALKVKLDKSKAERPTPPVEAAPPLATAMENAQGTGAPTGVTKEEAGEALKKFAAIHGAEEAVSILNNIGAENISGLAPAGRVRLLKDLAAAEQTKAPKKEANIFS